MPDSELPLTEWANQLKFRNRYQLTGDQQNFVQAALTYIAAGPHQLNAGVTLYRSRKNGIGQESAYRRSEMGAPPAHLHKGGRCSPPGIPCLYLASTPETAIAEVRPWKGALVSVAALNLTKSVKLADLRSFEEKRELGDPQRNVAWRAAAMLVLTSSFARPGHEESDLDYVPTQFISSILKAEGFEGLIYGSLMDATGENVALFDPGIAQVRSVSVYEVSSVHYWAEKTKPTPRVPKK